jgi:hypothetical protein
MTGADLLDTPTGTEVAQRSEAGQGILGAKEGKGMWVFAFGLESKDSEDEVTRGDPVPMCS